MRRLPVAVLYRSKGEPYGRHHARECDGQEHEVGVDGWQKFIERDIARIAPRPAQSADNAPIRLANGGCRVDGARLGYELNSRDVEILADAFNRAAV